MGHINLNYKIEIVRSVDWFAGGAQRHGALRQNPRPEVLEWATAFFENLVDRAVPLYGQLALCRR